MLYAILIFAEKAAETTTTRQPGLFDNPLFLLLPVILLYLFIVVLPGRRRQEKERQDLLNKMSKGDEVLTIGGIYGTVISVHETKDEVVVKVDDGTRLRMTKASIGRNMTAEENLKKAKEAAKAPKTPATPAASGPITQEKK